MDLLRLPASVGGLDRLSRMGDGVTWPEEFYSGNSKTGTKITTGLKKIVPSQFKAQGG
jgi:hypothetical protein